MLAKNRSGAYIPTGHIERRQMEATSPWIAAMDPIQGVLMRQADACPDCLQELEIKSREVYDAPEARVQRAFGEGTRPTKRSLVGSSRLYAPASHSYSTELDNPFGPDDFHKPSARSRKQVNTREMAVADRDRLRADQSFDRA